MEFKINVKGSFVYGVIENQEAKKLVILVHGFTGDWLGPENIFLKLSKRLQKENYAVLRFGFRGTPPSEGKFQEMTVETETKDLSEVIKFAQKFGYREITLLGESMGGTVVANCLEKPVKAIVFWYPAFNFLNSDFTEIFFNPEVEDSLEKRGYYLLDGFKVGKKFIEQINSINVFKEVKEISCPTFFLHGDKDKEVPCQESQKAYRIIKGPKEIKILPGADHCFKNEQKEVIDLTVNFIRKYL